ncbi:ADP-ribosylglycohydrolase family protein [Luteolibacter sp. Populi]|uniref:ADP-ribosylglycohydrolase family protein n=1 Tax=Luteolibacter sp. Populi TaxID=3230487 RepID=UPI0034667FF5
MNRERQSSCLLGGALGDSLGLPAEGLNAKRIARMWPGPLRHRFCGRCGMVSDDTEHALMTALSLNRDDHDAKAFARDLARRLRWWFAGIPAGIGLATARSILKLWCGVSPVRSGVWSAGNGPLMRAPVIGVCFSQDAAKRMAFADASTRITHSDPRAAEAARMIAEAAAMASERVQDSAEILQVLETMAESAEMKSRLPALREALREDCAVAEFADRIGRKAGFVSGFAPDSAAVALYAWLHHRGDFRATVEAVVASGGDTDTVAFIAGSLAGTDAGVKGMPAEWIDGLRDWPINAHLLRGDLSDSPIRYPVWPLSLARNFVFLLVVVGHVFRRALPPY